MNRDAPIHDGRWTNPFSTHRVRPGSLHFRFAPHDAIDPLMQELHQHRWRGQIVGPHGSGKTTLLRTLDAHWRHQARDPVTVTLHDRQRAMPRLPWTDFDDATQLIVDGYEQLSRLERWRLVHRCRARRCGLLVTSHQQQKNLPVLYQTQTTLELVDEIVRALLDTATHIEFDQPLRDFLGCNRNRHTQPPGNACGPSLVETRFAESQGDVRETLMLLYDDAETYFRARCT